MTNHTCHDCRTAIPAGAAVLRSISFERVAFCRPCWDLRHAVAEALLPAVVPVQRVGGSLSERIAAAQR